MKEHFIKILIGMGATAVLAGLVYAADMRIDQRVDQRMVEYESRQLERQINELIRLEETAPQLVTPRDKANLRIWQEQLRNLR